LGEEWADKNVFGREKLLMGAWRSKFIFLLIVYFAGFATAIYILVPVPENVLILLRMLPGVRASG